MKMTDKCNDNWYRNRHVIQTIPQTTTTYSRMFKCLKTYLHWLFML